MCRRNLVDPGATKNTFVSIVACLQHELNGDRSVNVEDRKADGDRFVPDCGVLMRHKLRNNRTQRRERIWTSPQQASDGPSPRSRAGYRPRG